MLPWQAAASPITSEVDGNCVRPTNRRQSGSEDRSKSNRLDTKNSRHSIPQAAQLFKRPTANAGVEGDSPRLSLGDLKGVFSSEREYPLWLPFPCAAQGKPTLHNAGEPLFLFLSFHLRKLFLLELAESRAARAHRRTARQRRDTQLHRKAQREQQRKRRFLPCDVSHSLLSFSAREHKRSAASEFCPQYTIGLHKNQPEFDRFYANIPRSANFGKARDILTSARQRVRSGCRRSIRPPRCRGGRARSDPPR